MARSLLLEFGNRRVRCSSVQYDHSTSNIVLCRHLFYLWVVSVYIENGIKLYSADEFALYVDKKSD